MAINKIKVKVSVLLVGFIYLLIWISDCQGRSANQPI